MLQEFDEEHEGDDIWIGPKYDGSGEDNILCQDCHEKRSRN
jgi:hypothetical protein